MKRSGPDSLASWGICIGCCLLNTLMFGMARLSGVLFVASVPRFQVSRETASFPYTFANVIRNTSGPLVGYLGHRYGVRSVTTFGCILGAVGVGSCFFAENIDTVTILWGVIFGLGFGLGNMLTPVSINQYFDKNRATASGISFAGAGLGSFILPPIVEMLLNTYGLSGTFLILAGFVLNCVPAALLLKTPKFEINVSQNNEYQTERSGSHSITPGMNVTLYSVENETKKYLGKLNEEKFTSIVVTPVEDADMDSPRLPRSYEERLRGMSTQTILYEYGVDMHTSEPLNDEEIMGNSKGRRTVDPSVLEAEVLSVLSISTSQDLNCARDHFFETHARSSSVQYENSIPTESLGRKRTVSADSIKNSFLTRNPKLGQQNDGYQEDMYDSKTKTAGTSLSLPQNFITKRTFSQTVCDKDAYFNPYLNDVNNLKCVPQKLKACKVPSITMSCGSSEAENFTVKHGKLDSLPETNASEKNEQSCLGAFSIIFDPVFILIAITFALYSFTFIGIFTIVVDFARDLNIGESNEKYVLMALSVGDIVGRLGLGWVTDGGYMSTTGFTALLFVCQGLAIAAIPLSDGFTILIIMVTLYGLAEAALRVIYPVIIAQYIDHDKQTVAIPSSNFLCGPVCLAIPPLIGYFRDHLGTYDYMFYLMAVMLFACSLSWMLAPCIVRCRNKK